MKTCVCAYHAVASYNAPVYDLSMPEGGPNCTVKGDGLFNTMKEKHITLERANE